MSVVLWIYTAVYLAGLCGLLFVTRHRGRYYAAAKGMLSALFVVVALLAYGLGERQNRGAFGIMLGALVLCAAGDILLGLANKAKKVRATPFLAGTISFGAAHALFCVVFYSQVPFAWYDVALSLMLMGTMRLLEAKDSIRLKKMRIPGYLYTFMVGLMTAKAIETALWQTQGVLQGIVLALGGVLFLVSDVVLLFLYFATHRRKGYRYANLTTYYVGVYFLALSCYWI